MNEIRKSQWQALIYYTLATLFTGWYVATAPFTISFSQTVFSNVIAGSKWVIQIIAALIFLRDQRWIFIKNICVVYFIGSCLLLPYAILSHAGISKDVSFFNGSHLLSIMVMIFLYYRAVTLSELKLTWWLMWLVCQIIGIMLQVTWVFRAL